MEASIQSLKIDYIVGKHLNLRIKADRATIQSVKDKLQKVASDYDNVLGLLDHNDMCEKHFKVWKKFFRSWQQIMKAICPHTEHGISQSGHEFCLKCKNITRRNVVGQDE